MKAKLKFSIILIVEFLAIALLLLLVFFAGKKTYTVTFELNGGTLISGDTEQRVTQGQSAVPPNVVKEGHYLLGWAGSYRSVTSNRIIRAIWEYETSPGIEYSDSENKTYTEITGCYPDIQGDIYIGAYHDDKMVLGIKASAFAGCEGITGVYLLDGILRIEESVFENCTSLTLVDIPSTVVRLGARAFAGCEALTEISLPEGLEYIGEEAFLGCESLETVTIPSTVKAISSSAFKNCKNLKEVIFADGEEIVEETEDGEDKEDKKDKEDSEEPKTVIIPSKVKIIGTDAFRGCESLQKVVLPSELAQISAGAFSGCNALTSITLPRTTAIIAIGAFTYGGLTVRTPIKESEEPLGWADGWDSAVTVVWEYTGEEE